jgi:lipoprotein-anchoring transpeptidase ErfK/SrfK
MSDRPIPRLGRRAFLASTAAAACATAAPSWAQQGSDIFAEEDTEIVQRNIAGFRAHRWQPHFDTLRGGAILVDTKARSLHYWSEDETVFKIYPTSVPLSPELTRLGRTEVTKKVEGPSWRPTPSMIERHPEWPPFVPPGPDNPMGTHAMHLSWRYYRIHGTHDVRKIGRQSANGCIGLYNEDIQELFALSNVGTQVLLI